MMTVPNSELTAPLEGKSYPRGMDGRSFAQLIAIHCGLGKALDIRCGDGALVGELLKLNVDAQGIDASKVSVDKANQFFPARFFQESVSACHFNDESFDIVVSHNFLETLSPEESVNALREMKRMTRRFVVLQVFVENDGAGLLRSRAWWESRCFELGLRRHPSSYQANDYESLGSDKQSISLILEKIPEPALLANPHDRGGRAHGLDMLREVGEAADVQLARYEWATSFARQGDCVLDVNCGTGYGSYSIGELGKAAKIIGMDGCAQAIEYAEANFSSINKTCSFAHGDFFEGLSRYPDGFFDLIVAFEALDITEDPNALLAEFERLLSPGGRVLVSVKSDADRWDMDVDHPDGRNGYTLQALKSQIGAHFMPEVMVRQISTGCPSSASPRDSQPVARVFREVALDIASPPPSEWWLMAAMKNPVLNKLPYRESVYGYSSPPEQLLQFEEAYENPWLIRSMLEFQFRARNPKILARLAKEVLQSQDGKASTDAGAALAVLGYQLLENSQATSAQVEEFIARLQPYVEAACHSGHSLRWQVSHSYLIAQLYKKIGLFAEAGDFLKLVVDADVRNFSPTLGTKVVDAAYEAGILQFSSGNIESARNYWKAGVERAYALVSSPLVEFVGEMDRPHEFPSIVAVEFMDSAVRCIKALRATFSENGYSSNKIYAFTRENWKEMLKDRWAAMQSMESMIGERDQAISAQSNLLEERWAAMQSMESMIRERDQAISAQNDLLEERWTAMQSMESMISDRDQAISAQEAMLEERWVVMQSMEAKISDRDTSLAVQHAILDDREKTVESMAALICERDEIIQAQLKVIQQQTEAQKSMTDFYAKKFPEKAVAIIRKFFGKNKG